MGKISQKIENCINHCQLGEKISEKIENYANHIQSTWGSHLRKTENGRGRCNFGPKERVFFVCDVFSYQNRSFRPAVTARGHGHEAASILNLKGYFTYKYITWPDSLVILVAWEMIAKEEAGCGASPPRLRWRRKGSSILFILLNLIFFVSNKEGWEATSSLNLLFIWSFCQQWKIKGSVFLFGDGRHRKEQHVGIIFSLFIQFSALAPWAAD